jgi:conjugal transfer pilus assembly protein TraA
MKMIQSFANKKSLMIAALMSAVMLQSAHAGTVGGGTTGTEFLSLFNMLVGWAEGYLGKALAIGAFIVGAIIGFAKSTAMPALVGVVFAIVFGLGPTIINGMFSAVI